MVTSSQFKNKELFCPGRLYKIFHEKQNDDSNVIFDNYRSYVRNQQISKLRGLTPSPSVKVYLRSNVFVPCKNCPFIKNQHIQS